MRNLSLEWKEMETTINVYIGYDQREDLAYQVCRASILKHCGPETNIFKIEPIVQDWLRAKSIYTRQKDIFASTDFSLTRFLTPYLNNYEGYAIFMDLDFVVTGNLLKEVDMSIKKDNDKAVWLVKHDYISRVQRKMDNKIQHAYPKKNWSSFMIFDCAHPAMRTLTPEYINQATSQDLHQFRWINEKLVGELPIDFNFLVGEYNKSKKLPLCLHFTLGLPFVGEIFTNDYLDVWNQYEKEYQETR